MVENEHIQYRRLNKPLTTTWRQWLTIGFGILLPAFFLAIGCLFIIASGAPLWAMGIGVSLGLGWGTVWRTSNLFAPNSRTMRSWLSVIGSATLMSTLWFTSEWAAIPRHLVPFAFIPGFIFSYGVGMFVGILSFNMVAARLRK